MVCFFYTHNSGDFMTLARFVLVILFGYASVLQAEDTHTRNIRVIADEWPPLTGSRLSHGGFSVQLATEVLQALGYTVRIEFAPWKRILKISKRGQYDLVSAMWKDQSRERSFVFTEGYHTNKVVFVSLSNISFQYRTTSDLAGKRVGIVSSYAYPEAFLQSPSVIWDKSIDLNQNIKKILGNRLDVAVGTEDVMRYEARQLEGSERLYYDVTHPIEVRSLHMGVNRKYAQHQKLVKELDEMIRSFKQSGRFDQIKKQHGLM